MPAPPSGSTSCPSLSFGTIPPFHSTLGRFPFEVLYGHAPWHFGLSAEAVGSDVLALNQWLSERALMQDLVKQHLLRAQARMKHQSDKRRSEREFAVGD